MPDELANTATTHSIPTAGRVTAARPADHDDERIRNMTQRQTAATMPDDTREQERERLETYGRELAAAGFRVWLSRSGTRDAGYLTYERGGNYGHLQRSDFEGWAHSMPLVPSREYGSGMFIGDPLPVWTVAAAQQTARATNRNDVVGTRRNAGARTWLNPAAVALHGDVTPDVRTFERDDVAALEFMARDRGGNAATILREVAGSLAGGGAVSVHIAGVDLAGSASRQHYVDTGAYLPTGGAL
jgi:hypothetical protein